MKKPCGATFDIVPKYLFSLLTAYHSHVTKNMLHRKLNVLYWQSGGIVSDS